MSQFIQAMFLGHTELHLESSLHYTHFLSVLQASCVHLHAAVCCHGCVCKNRMIFMFLHNDPESYSCMLMARLMMAARPALPGQMDVE